MGIIKAERLKYGYVDPEELIKPLRQLKPSHNFSLRRYHHPPMLWNKSPVHETPRIHDVPVALWVADQEYGIQDLKKELSESSIQSHLEEARKYWNKVRDIKLDPVPDIWVLTHINHSSSGTLFPRYLVKGLWGLLNIAHDRGLKYCDDREERAGKKREEIICSMANRASK